MNARIKIAPGVALALAACAAGMWTLSNCGVDSIFREEYERFGSIQIGMTEEEVREKLGEPTYVYERSTAPKDYYVKGYSFKRRDITNKVLIYVGSEPIGYYYLDGSDKVEKVFVGGS